MHRDYRTIYLNAKKTMTTITETCDYILAGHSENEACLRYNIDKHKFRRLLRTNYSNENQTLDDKVCTEGVILPSEKLYCKIMGIDIAKQDGTIIPIDLDKSFEMAFQLWLTPDEINIIRSRYWDNKTLQNIADEYNLTRECIRIKESKIITKLSTKKCKELLVYGVDDFNERNELIKQQTNIQKAMRQVETSEFIKDLTKKLTDIRLQNDIHGLRKLKKQIDTLLSTYDNTDDAACLNVLICDEIKSVRTRNTIKYIDKYIKRLKYVSDLESFSKTELLKYRNVGKVALQELIDIANKYGIVIPE